MTMSTDAFEVTISLRRRLRDLRSAERRALDEYVTAVQRGDPADSVRRIGERRRAAAAEREDLYLALAELESRSL